MTRNALAVFALMPLLLNAVQETVDGITWNYSVVGGEAVLGLDPDEESQSTAIPDETVGSVTVPSTLGGCPVTRIYCPAFYGCNGLTSVSLPSSVTNIGVGAFTGCSKLTNFVVSAENNYYETVNGLLLTKDRKSLVAGVNGSVVVPEGVTNILAGAFAGCSGLSTIIIPSTVTGIRGGPYIEYMNPASFYGCTGLVSVTIPDRFSCSDLFADARQTITNVIFTGTSGGKIVAYSLYGFSALKSVQIPDGVGFIGESAFYGCGELTNVTIPDSVTNIAAYAFRSCAGLTSLTIPDGVLRIGWLAFWGCTGLKSVSIPESVKYIENDLDEGCAFTGCSAIETLIIPSRFSVRLLFPDAYASMANVTLLAVDGEICECALWGCKNITALRIPNDITNICGSAFSGCKGLTEIEIPSCVTNIGPSAFADCCGLQSITIPANVKTIGAGAFSGCSGLKSVALPDRFRLADIFPDGYGCVTNVCVLVGDGTVCDRAFEDCRCLTSLILAGGITEIGESAFENCRRIESVVIPASVKKIDAYAFYGCGRLKTVTYLGEKPEIEGAAFEGTGVVNSSIVTTVNVVVTNIVVQYVFNSVQPEFANPASSDRGFVNIIAEVKGSCVPVPESWAEDYPSFKSIYGSDFAKALATKTGKKDGAGNDMLVWQDYVAGTDPTNEKDVFTASITLVDGKVKISYSPELDDDRKSLRRYTTWGKKSLLEATWTEVSDGDESDYNFFKVSVEMRPANEL